MAGRCPLPEAHLPPAPVCASTFLSCSPAAAASWRCLTTWRGPWCAATVPTGARPGAGRGGERGRASGGRGAGHLPALRCPRTCRLLRGRSLQPQHSAPLGRRGGEQAPSARRSRSVHPPTHPPAARCLPPPKVPGQGGGQRGGGQALRPHAARPGSPRHPPLSLAAAPEPHRCVHPPVRLRAAAAAGVVGHPLVSPPTAAGGRVQLLRRRWQRQRRHDEPSTEQAGLHAGLGLRHELCMAQGPTFPRC